MLFKRKVIYRTVALALLFHSTSYAEVFFNPEALEKKASGGADIDLTVFQKRHNLPDGSYQVDVYVNGQYVDTDFVQFGSIEGKEGLVPLLKPEQLNRLGLENKSYPVTADGTINVQDFIPESRFSFDQHKSRLNLTVPQSALKQVARGYIDPQLWDQGINALFVDYRASGTNTSARNSNGHDSDRYYLNMRSGLNLGAWRLRNYSTYVYENGGEDKWDNIQLYAQRDIHSIRSQLTLGEQYTPSQLFDTFSFRGIQLSSDETMLPDSLSGYAPIVRGIANTNATVSIRQSGHIIFEKEVSPGPFVISDLYEANTGEDLEVVIKESNGEERRFFQGYSALPILEREGQFRYSINAGQYHQRSQLSDNHPNFLQGTIIYGLPKGFTVYSGANGSNDYQALLAGVGKNMGDWGAASFDITHSNSDIRQRNYKGQRYRLQHYKQFSTNTTISTGYDFYTKEPFYNFSEATDSEGNHYARRYNGEAKKDRLLVNLIQSTNRLGNFSLSFDQYRYWHNNEKQRTIQANYSTYVYKDITFNMSYSYQKLLYRDRDRHQFSLGIQVPLDRLFSIRDNYVSYYLTHDNNKNNTHSVSLYGSALKQNQLTYTLQKNYTSDEHHSDNSGSISLGYLASQGQLETSYSHERNQERYNYTLSGGVIVHGGGVTLSQPLNDGFVLINTQGIKDVRMQNKPTVKTDRFGYAVLPYTQPYRYNQINLDIETLEDDTDALISSYRVVPTKGAVSHATFSVQQGIRALVTMNYGNKPIPFGTTVSVFDNRDKKISEGIVDSDGKVFLSGLEDNVTLTAEWGNNTQCRSNKLRIPSKARNQRSDNQFETYQLECQ